MRLKSILAYTNPVTIIVGIPVLIGIITSAMLDGIVKKTTKVVKEVNDDIM